jgi:SPOR domain
MSSSGLVLLLALSLAGCSHEGADWKSATSADTSEAYQQFLTQHPNSANAVQAHTRMAQLQEERDWQAATSADTRDAYEQFLAQHADSKWAQEARIRIENFAQSGGGANPATVVADANTAKAAQAGVAQAGVPAASKAAARAGTALANAPQPSMATGGAATLAGAQYVQLGAFSSKAHAEWQWKRLTERFAHELGTLSPHYVLAKGRSVVRLQVAVASKAQAKALCAKLKAHSQPCVQVTTG